MLAGLLKELATVHEERKALSIILKTTASVLGCECGTIFLHRRAKAGLHKVKSLRGAETWDIGVVESFYRNEKPGLPADVVMAPLRVGKHVVGVLALRKAGEFERGAGRVATEILKTAGSVLGWRKEIAYGTAENSVAQAALRGVAAKDIVYRVFHQLRRFIDYDHGGTLLEQTAEGSGRIVARQIAWTEGKSGIVGRHVAIPWSDIRVASPTITTAADRPDLWPSIVSMSEETAPPKRSALIGLVRCEAAVCGLIEVSSRRPDFFVDSDAEIFARFIPYVSWALSELRTQPGGKYERGDAA
jgi:hypothetical protein